MIRTVKIRYGFRNAADGQIQKLGWQVHHGMTGNGDFPDPPVTMDALKTACDAFDAAIAAALRGGPSATAEKNQKRVKLMGLLRQLGQYVEERSKNDEATLLSSGFPAQNRQRIQTELMKPSILSLEYGMSTQFKLSVTAIPNSRGYDVRIAPTGKDGMPGPWQDAGFFTNSRAIVVTGLKPGTVYSLQVRAKGGTTGNTDWSDAISRLAV